MSSGAIAAVLPDGRLHLQHGPIDLIIAVEGPGREAALDRAVLRFETILTDLTRSLDLWTRAYDRQAPSCPVSERMLAAVAPLAADRFVTPMAAVAGAVADEICTVLVASGVQKVSVNNGGDIAFFLTTGEEFRATSAHGVIEIGADSPVRGLATSGWRGRSQSLGIADAVTVFAPSAARADAAATLIANAVDLPGHRAVTRRPASEVEAVPQLRARLVTVAVGPLTATEVTDALDQGQSYAARLQSAGLITGAQLLLAGKARVIGSKYTAPMLPADPF